MKHSFLLNSGIFIPAGLLLTGLIRDWNLPWPITAFLVAVAVVCACIEGIEKGPTHD